MKKIVLLICMASISIGATAQNRENRDRGGRNSGNSEREIRRIVTDEDRPVRTDQINERLGRGLVFRGTPNNRQQNFLYIYPGRNSVFREIPNLTEEQKTKLNELQTVFEKENRRANNLINEKRARLRTLQDEDDIDQNAVNKTIDELTALQAGQMKAQVDYKIKVRTVLTPEQREVYNRFYGRSVFRNNLGRFNIRTFPPLSENISIEDLGMNFNFDMNAIAWDIE